MLFLPRYLIVITCQTTRAGVGVLFLLCVCGGRVCAHCNTRTAPA
jgi:hypothetical protein